MVRKLLNYVIDTTVQTRVRVNYGIGTYYKPGYVD